MHLFDDAGNETSGDSAATLTDGDALTGLNGDGVDESGVHLDVVTGLDHLAIGILSALGEGEGAGLVGGADVHLGAVAGAEALVAATLLLGQDVHGDEELSVGLDGAGLDDDHAALDVLAADTTEEETGVVTGLGLLAGLLEGLDVGDLGLDDLLALADKLDFLIALEDTTLDTARDDGTTARDGEDVLDGHEEGLVGVTLGGGDPLVDSLHELVDLVSANIGALALEGAEGGAHDDGSLLAVEAVGGEKLTHLHLDELQHLGVIDGINLVDEDDDALDTDLTGEQQVLTGLGHLTIGGGDDDDSTIHGGGTSNHVLDVIGVTRAVDVGVVASLGRVLDVGGGDGDTTLALLRSLVDGTIVEEAGEALVGLSLGDGSRKGGLAVIDVTNGTDVDVRLGALISGICAGEVEDGRAALALQRRERVRRRSERGARSAQEGRKRPESRRHFDWIIICGWIPAYRK